jgi:hypothetical protein
MKSTTQFDEMDITEAEFASAATKRSTFALDDPVPQVAVQSLSAVVVGNLVGLQDDGRTALVTFPTQRETSALPARTAVDLDGRHIGAQVALMFDGGDAAKPIVVGVIRDGDHRLERAAQADVEADGERLTVTAKRQLTLRCGPASITLTKEGKVIIQGTFVSSRSSGVNRIAGGSVQIN